MKLGEKMSYLMGLLDGMEIDTATKEGKALVQMADVMREMVECIDDLQAQVDELTELCDILDSDLGEIEEEFYDLDDCDCGCDDFDNEELYEVCCPDCEHTVVIDGEMADKGFMICPVCGQELEFDFDDFDDFDDVEFDETPEE